MNSKTFLVIAVLLAIFSFLAGSMWTKTRYLEKKNQELVVEKEQKLTPSPGEKKAEATATPASVLGELTQTIGNFVKVEEEVCEEEEKPLIYYFGASTCPHCQWEHPIIKEVAGKFEGEIAFHDNMDKREADGEVYEKYLEVNRGAIPFLLFGCQYARVGSGEQLGEEEEAKVLTALICQLTEGKPEDVCETVADLRKEVK